MKKFFNNYNVIWWVFIIFFFWYLYIFRGLVYIMLIGDYMLCVLGYNKIFRVINLEFIRSYK